MPRTIIWKRLGRPCEAQIGPREPNQRNWAIFPHGPKSIHPIIWARYADFFTAHLNAFLLKRTPHGHFCPSSLRPPEHRTPPPPGGGLVGGARATNPQKNSGNHQRCTAGGGRRSRAGGRSGYRTLRQREAGGGSYYMLGQQRRPLAARHFQPSLRPPGVVNRHVLNAADRAYHGRRPLFYRSQIHCSTP